MDILCKKDFIASPYRSERDKLIVVKRWNVRKFFKLLEKLEEFFEDDKCCRLADNYLIAMVFTYFLRASLNPEEYTRQNFFAALYLAYNMEEDESEFMLSEVRGWLGCSVAELKKRHYALFRRMEYRGAVSRSCCEVVMRSVNPEHKMWLRHRHAYHSGVVNGGIHIDLEAEDLCPICRDDNEDEADYF